MIHMKRIAILQVVQESNSFNPIATTRTDFERFGVAEGGDVISQYGSVGEIGGFLQGLDSWNEPVEPVGIVRFQANPGGPVDAATLDWILTSVAYHLESAGALDGALFALHGAMIGEDEDDIEGCICTIVRDILGPDIPIVVTLDLHAYLTPRLAQKASALVAYHTSPHVDLRETGVRGANVLGRILAGAQPVFAAQTLPMISIAEVQQTSGDILGPIFAVVSELEKRRDVLSAGVLMTQCWLDVPELGWSTFVIADADMQLAEEMAEELADACWRVRDELTGRFHSAKECIRLANAHSGSPVIVADGADSTNSGSTGDSTFLLAEMLARGVPGGGLVIIVDPEAVAQAKTIGSVGRFRFAVGGKRAPSYYSPVEVEGTVESISAARYILTGHGGVNLPIDMGTGAVIRAADVTILLVESAGPGGTPLMYRCVGLEPTDYKIVVVKSPAGFRAEYGGFASMVLLSDCAGCASPRLSELPFTRISRPLIPIDILKRRIDATWSKTRWE